MSTNPQKTVDFLTFTKEIPNGKLHFCAVFMFVFPVQKQKYTDYNNFHNILRLVDVLPNFLFITSEMKRDF